MLGFAKGLQFATKACQHRPPLDTKFGRGGRIRTGDILSPSYMPAVLTNSLACWTVALGI